VFVYAAALMLEEGVNRAINVGGRPDNVIVLRKGSEAELASGIENTDLALLRGGNQVNQAVGELVLVITCERADGSGGISNLLVRGMPPEGYKFRPEFKLESGEMPKPGTNEVLIGRAVSGRFIDPSTNEVIKPGGSVEIKTNRALKVVGTFSAAGSSYEAEVWGDVKTVQQYAGRETVVSSVRVRLNSPGDFDSYKDTVERDTRLSVKVMREQDYLEDQSQATSQFLKLMGISIAVMFSIAAVIGAIITMNAAVANRSREIGTLRALGFGRMSILFSFLLEAVFLAALGGVIGSVLVLALSFVSFPIINFQTFSEIVISFTATPSVFTKSIVVSAVMGLIGGLIPAIRAARISPVEAMRG
jgi:putative ABC transport system permease protein